MEETIIEDLIKNYGVEPTKEIVLTYLKLISLGFNNTWLRNMCIIREFDSLYNTMKQTEIYLDLSIKHKIHEDSIRRIIANRKEYEI